MQSTVRHIAPFAERNSIVIGASMGSTSKEARLLNTKATKTYFTVATDLARSVKEIFGAQRASCTKNTHRSSK